MSTEKYRTGLKRFWAAILDGIVFLPFLLLEQWIYKTTNNISFLFIWATFIVFAPILYSIILHYKYGQTYGKWVVGVKVLDINENRKLTLYQSIYRDSFYLLVAFIALFYYAVLLMHTGEKGNILNDYSSFADKPIFWWTAIELITMLTNSKRRALHDFIAKSIVVRTEKSI
ncbi:MAG: RDD family protein [Ginsengibacter sp.]